MYIPYFSDTVDPRSMIDLPALLDTSRFSLDIAGVLGLLGGHEAISAMATIPVYRSRRWFGWYNTPGSYQLAKRYGLSAKSLLFKGLFAGPRTDPAGLFEFSGWQGPAFQAAHSGTVMADTGHLASVLTKYCADKPIDRQCEGRGGSGVRICVVQLRKDIQEQIDPQGCGDSFPFAIIPIASSLAACIASGLKGDWFSCLLILWGILSNGVSCLLIGSATLRFCHHTPAAGSPCGDGILGTGSELVILLGDENDVNFITRGKFSLVFPSQSGDKYVGCCSILFGIQFIAQLFLIPQASLFGQIMFISSLVVSSIYNSWLASSDKIEIQAHILLDEISENWGEEPLKRAFGTRTAAVVFALCTLFNHTVNNRTLVPLEFGAVDGQNCINGGSRYETGSTSPAPPPASVIPPPRSASVVASSDLPSGDLHGVAKKILDAYLPNNTKVWNLWKDTISTRLVEGQPFNFTETDWNIDGYSDDERILLEALYRDAQNGYDESFSSHAY